ncbi:hypothetical protein A0H81_02095 [Grifola frondosa]|uniref:Uncharacterized protein n=1 Tax=Grifola frondosa TaxID=5627 RepID=A0A1C7MNK6_GRIFR|nr:hypothetical protein A0H81_02095 [Grifola frondosa]
MSQSSNQESFVDPDQPPSRPCSALSGSGDSFVNYSEEDDEDYADCPEYLPPRQISSALRRDNTSCLLCGKQSTLSVYRLIGEDNDDTNPYLSWLQGLKFIPAHYNRDSLANLMTLCQVHAEAYFAGVWRLVPCAFFRRGMLTCVLRRDNAIQQEKTMSSEVSSKAESVSFDLLVFLPEHMPPLSSLEHSSPDHDGWYRALSPKPASRVLPSQFRLQIDPYIAYAASLDMIGKAYWPPPDDALGLYCGAISIENWFLCCVASQPVVTSEWW